MKRFKKDIFTFLLMLLLLMPAYVNAAAQRGITVRPISPSGADVSGAQWLFVIGINNYTNWPRLKTATGDAKALKEVLLTRYHFDKEHVIELYDGEATRKNILAELRNLAKNVREEDSVIIFYAGHGHLDPITKAGSWIPVDSGLEDVSAWISNYDIKNYLNVDAIKAKHILLVSDSCFSGDFFRDYRDKLPEVTDKVVRKAYELTSRQALTSGGLEPVSDEGFGGHSVFTYFLLKTLKENKKPFLIPSDFFQNVKAGVAENAEQFPRFASLRDTGGQQDGELVLFLKEGVKPEELAATIAKQEPEKTAPTPANEPVAEPTLPTTRAQDSPGAEYSINSGVGFYVGILTFFGDENNYFKNIASAFDANEPAGMLTFGGSWHEPHSEYRLHYDTSLGAGKSSDFSITYSAIAIDVLYSPYPKTENHFNPYAGGGVFFPIVRVDGPFSGNTSGFGGKLLAGIQFFAGKNFVFELQANYSHAGINELKVGDINVAKKTTLSGFQFIGTVTVLFQGK